jgi:hypothetical protein
MNQLAPITLNDAELADLKFTKQINEDGTVKYSKGAFRMQLPAVNDFSKMELWYRDEHRHRGQKFAAKPHSGNECRHRSEWSRDP